MSPRGTKQRHFCSILYRHVATKKPVRGESWQDRIEGGRSPRGKGRKEKKKKERNKGFLSFFRCLLGKEALGDGRCSSSPQEREIRGTFCRGTSLSLCFLLLPYLFVVSACFCFACLRALCGGMKALSSSSPLGPERVDGCRVYHAA